MNATRHPSITKALNLALAQPGYTRELAILMVIRVLVEAGVPITKATDSVLGPGTYQMISDTTWEALQVK
jgi:hypothetical protein